MLNKNSINSVNQNNGFQQQTRQQQPEIPATPEANDDDEKTLHLTHKILENHLREKDIATIKCETIDIKKEVLDTTTVTKQGKPPYLAKPKHTS